MTMAERINLFFFFQAEDGIRDLTVTGVQTCALPISVFRVKYVSEGSVYIEAGRNADLEEGMKLSVVEAPPDGMIAEGLQYRGYPHVEIGRASCRERV